MKTSETFGESKFYHDLIESIVTALEARDVYTANHSRRVSDMAEKICRFLDLNQKDIETIHIAADVHDIGKIGIPDHILLKPDKLMEDEWLIMKSHPTIGANILSKSKLLEPVTSIVLHHHERYDGKGYPDGLKGNDIPYGARVIAVCDSIDAMLSKRPYRDPLSIQICRDEIEINIGYMYDPQIAECVLENFNQIIN